MLYWWQKLDKTAYIQATPWLHANTTKYLESILRPDMEIIEHGSGGSTLWFAARCASVTAYESDPDWYARMVDQGIPDNAALVMWTKHAPPKLKANCCDLLVIDGEPVEDRAAWIKAAPRLVRNGGYIVLDNANRKEYVNARQALQDKGYEFLVMDCNDDISKHMVTDFYKVTK